MINLKSNTQTLVAIWSRTLGFIADTFVIFLELSILIDIWSIRSRTQKDSLLFEVGLRGLYSWHVCNISWAFNFNRHLINVKLETQTLVAIWSRTLGFIADTFVIFLELSILIDILSIWSRILGVYSWRVCIVMFLELSILIDIWSSFRVLSELSPLVITRWIKKIMLTNPLIWKKNLNT